MRRTLLIASTLLTVLLAALGITINLHCAGAEPLPPPDPAMPITLSDGSQLPLGELLARVARDEPLPMPPQAEPAETPTAAPTLSSLRAAPDGAVRHELSEEQLKQLVADLQAAGYTDDMRSWLGPVFMLAEEHLEKGNLDQAEALFLSIREDEPGYAYARRCVAWDILTEGRGQPERAVNYAHEALLADPLNGNSWQDLARVYGSTLGFPMD
jgi:hypothetical protein